jgi:hypothetical protein
MTGGDDLDTIRRWSGPATQDHRQGRQVFARDERHPVRSASGRTGRRDLVDSRVVHGGRRWADAGELERRGIAPGGHAGWARVARTGSVWSTRRGA